MARQGNTLPVYIPRPAIWKRRARAWVDGPAFNARQSLSMTRARKKIVRSHGARGEAGREAKDRPRRLSRFAQALLAEWKRLALPMEGARVVVAVSGGADSVSLLLGLDELLKAGRLKLSTVVAHLDHGLRAASREDARWVADWSRSLGYEVEIGRASVGELAEQSRDNLEQAARVARYEFLARVANRHEASAVLTAHTLDDQAETVLLRLMRGSGAEGLGGIEPVRLLEAKESVLLARPLLNWARRAGTEEYCRSCGVEWRSDEMNRDERFARVRVRHSLIPMMQSFNARVVEGLARTAQLLREDAAALDISAAELLEEARVVGSERERGGPEGERMDGSARASAPALRVDVLAGAPSAVRRRALRRWLGERRGSLRRLEMVHLVAVERLLFDGRGGRVSELPGGASVSRRKGQLVFHAKKVEKRDGDR